jgi:hypothetical protein
MWLSTHHNNTLNPTATSTQPDQPPPGFNASKHHGNGMNRSSKEAEDAGKAAGSRDATHLEALVCFFFLFLFNYTNLCLETIYSAYGRHCHLCTHAHTDSQPTHTGDKHQDDKQLPKRWHEGSRPARLEPLEVRLIFSTSFYYYANDYIGNYMCTNEERGTESRQGWRNRWLRKWPRRRIWRRLGL